MSLQIRNWNETPPGGWRFRLAQTGRWFPDAVANRGFGHYSYNDLEAEVTRYCGANGIAVPANLRQEIVEQLCQQLPAGWCRDTERAEWRGGAGAIAAFERVVQGTLTLADWFVRGGRLRVPIEESARRAAICSGCLFNQTPQGCGGCSSGALATAANTIVGGDRQPFDALLKSCLICACTLSAKIRLPVDVLRRHMKPAMLAQLPPAHSGFPGCWVREDATPPSL